MFRDKGFKPNNITVNFILMDGGVGDHIASLTVLNYIHHKYPFVKQLVWVPDFLLEFAQHHLSKLLIRPFSSMRQYYDPHLPTKTTKWDQIVSPMKTSLIDYAYIKLCDENPPIEHKNYLQINPKKIDISKFDLNKDYIVLTTGFTAEVREFPVAEVNKIVHWATDNSIDVVFLGQTETKTGGVHTIKGNFTPGIEYKWGTDLRNQTTLLEAAAIMHNSKAVLGVDNGLIHVAATTQTPIIAGFTTVDPKCRIPYRNNQFGYKFYPITPDESLKCRFCQSNTNFIYEHPKTRLKHDYRFCLYDADKNACTRHMTAEKFLNILKSIL